MPTPNTLEGWDTDLLAHLFLKAPLPNLPCPHHLFQNMEDVKTSRAEFTHQQLVDHYHTVISTIKAGFGANLKLSPSAWVQTTSDLIARILQGVLTSRNFGSDREPLDQDEFKNLLNEEDWEAVQRNLINLQHLTQIFPPPIHPGDPPLICGHCFHQTNPEASEQLTMADYYDVLMATDHSRSAVMGHLMNILSSDLKKEVRIWVLEETAKRREDLRPRLLEDAQMHYSHHMKKIMQEQDQCAEADLQDYYSKHLFDLKNRS
jgi:hypothetical protein